MERVCNAARQESRNVHVVSALPHLHHAGDVTPYTRRMETIMNRSVTDRLTLAGVQIALGKIGMSVQRMPSTEFRVHFLREWEHGCEANAYYTDSLTDALATARLMHETSTLQAFSAHMADQNIPVVAHVIAGFGMVPCR
jgi:predicted alpha/beta hydrolase